MIIPFALPGPAPDANLRFLIRRPADGYLYNTARRRMMPPAETTVLAWGTVIVLGDRSGRTTAEYAVFYGAAVGEKSFEEGDYELVVSARNIVSLRFAFSVDAGGLISHGGALAEAIGALPADTAGDSRVQRWTPQRRRIVE